MLTAESSAEAKLRALAAGATDFLTKPFDVSEATLRVANLLDRRFLHRTLENMNQTLEFRVRQRSEELESSYSEMLERLALAAEYRDDDTGGHIQRVGRTAALVARELGLPPDQVDLISRGAAMHDVGKIGIPDAILLKPGRLTPQEFEIVKTHTVIGARILAGSRSPLLKMAESIARSHHERWDGCGYAGLAREAIPLEARITAVSDTFDAMTSDRPYRGARSVEEAVTEIRDERGRQFDPDVVDAFLVIRGGARAPVPESLPA